MVREFPDNGFVDADGRLTAAGQRAVERFFEVYDPLAFLGAKWRTVYTAVMGLIRSRRITADDFRATVWVAACRHVRDYDPAFGTDVVRTYLPMSVLDAARDLIRWHLRQLPATPFYVDADGVTWEPPGRERPVGWEVDAADEVARIRATVSEWQWAAMGGRYLDDKKDREVAAEMDVTRQRVGQLCEEGATKVRRRITLQPTRSLFSRTRAPISPVTLATLSLGRGSVPLPFHSKPSASIGKRIYVWPSKTTSPPSAFSPA